jgi:hypothetical protein
LTIAPEYWDRAIAQRLRDSTMELSAAWKTHHVGLFTFAQSTKHVGLYQKYGFWPRFLTAIMSSPVNPASDSRSTRVSGVGNKDLPSIMRAVGELTNAVYPGLDLSLAIEAVLAQRLADTVLIEDGVGLQAVAVRHTGVHWISFALPAPSPPARLCRGCGRSSGGRAPAWSQTPFRPGCRPRGSDPGQPPTTSAQGQPAG